MNFRDYDYNLPTGERETDRFDVRGAGDEALCATLQLAFALLRWNTVAGYKRDDTQGLVLYRFASESDSIPFPVPIDAIDATPLVIKWLDSEPEHDTLTLGEDDEYPDYAEDASRGWRVHLGSYNTLVITPSYIEYGK